MLLLRGRSLMAHDLSSAGCALLGEGSGVPITRHLCRRVERQSLRLDLCVEVLRQRNPQRLRGELNVRPDPFKKRLEVTASHRCGEIQRQLEIFAGDVVRDQEVAQCLRDFGLDAKRVPFPEQFLNAISGPLVEGREFFRCRVFG